jgi:hypothetical protein
MMEDSVEEGLFAREGEKRGLQEYTSGQRRKHLLDQSGTQRQDVMMMEVASEKYGSDFASNHAFCND